MNYRLTCLTPTLVGDGQRLSPIDYMVWKDHVNVLDQWRIFRLLAKGPRLEGYLTQLKKADKLDFASWGGFAQNYAGRRIPFEHPSSTQYWERTHAEHLFIPTFSTGPSGPYLPGTAHQGRVSHRGGAWPADRALCYRSGGAHRIRRQDARAGPRSRWKNPHWAVGRRSVARPFGMRFQDRPRQHVQDVSAAHFDARSARRRQIRTGLEADSARQREARRRQHARCSPKWRTRAPCSKASGMQNAFLVAARNRQGAAPPGAD